jgi:dTDP-4-dehydrorhamnose reductase
VADKGVLIIGGSGFVGSNLALSLRHKYKVWLTYRNHPLAIRGVTSIPCRAEREEWLKYLLLQLKPEVIIYTAGTNNPEWSDKYAKEAEQVHATNLNNICQIASLHQWKVVYFSNPYVFDGTKGNYHEKDLALPLTNLGRSKLSGENTVRSRSNNHLVIRTAPLLGFSNSYNPSLIDTLRYNLSRKIPVTIKNSEYFNFSPIQGLVSLVELALDLGIHNEIIQYGSLTRMTYFEVATLFAKKFKYDPSLILPGADTELTAAGRKAKMDYSLNMTHVIDLLKINPLFIEQCLDLLQDEFIPAN